MDPYPIKRSQIRITKENSEIIRINFLIEHAVRTEKVKTGAYRIYYCINLLRICNIFEYRTYTHPTKCSFGCDLSWDYRMPYLMFVLMCFQDQQKIVVVATNFFQSEPVKKHHAFFRRRRPHWRVRRKFSPFRLVKTIQ